MGGNTLAGFILDKAFQSRKAARASDKKSKSKKSKKKSEKEDAKPSLVSVASNAFGGSLSSLSNIFKPQKKEAEKTGESTGTRTSGGATGLAKILTQGFGSLTADTLGLASGLASVTNILNNQLKTQSFTASGVQTIASILTDQLENQSSIVSGMKSLRPGGGSPKAGGSMFGTSKSKGVSAKETMTGFITEKVNEAIRQATGVGAGALIGNAVKGVLTSPLTWIGVSMAAMDLKSRNWRDVETSRLATKESEKTGKSKEQILSERAQSKQGFWNILGDAMRYASPSGMSLGDQIDVTGKRSSGAIIKHSSGIVKFAAGGMNGAMNSMIGEAGKEAVVDLNSKESRGILNRSNDSKGDPGMQSSGASTLAVVDQFVKSMGPLGAPVAQALGPDISNLARTFGMSQTLPNIKIGGGRFKEDVTAKKTRDKFLEDLISGSLEALGAKKKESKQEVKPPTQTKQEQKTQSNPDNPDTGSATQQQTGQNGKPMDVHDPKAFGAGRQSVIKGEKEGVGVTDVDRNRQTNQLEANHVNFNHKGVDYKVRINPNNGDYEVFQTRGHLGLVDKKIDVGGAQGPRKGQANEAILQVAHNEVRRFFLVNAPQKGLSLKYINQSDIDRNEKVKKDAMVNGDQQVGGTVRPVTSFDKGGAVQKPWWDFLGWVTGAKEVQKGTTGIYSNSAMGRIGEAAAQRNKMLKEFGYERGGSAFTNLDSNIESTPTDLRIRALEDITVTMVQGMTANNQSSNNVRPPQIPRVSPSSFTPMATNEIDSDMGSSAIVNIIQSQSSAPLPTSSEETQSTSSYINDPYGGGLAFAILSSSPWGN